MGLDLETDPDVDVPSKTEEICQVVKEAVEDKMGLKLRKVRANIKHAPYSVKPQMPETQAPYPLAEQVVPEDTPYPTEQEMVSEEV